jgi:hypothetical protein
MSSRAVLLARDAKVVDACLHILQILEFRPGACAITPRRYSRFASKDSSRFEVIGSSSCA